MLYYFIPRALQDMDLVFSTMGAIICSEVLHTIKMLYKEDSLKISYIHIIKAIKIPV